MLLGIPVIHRIQQRLRLMHGQHRPLGQHVEMLIGDDGRDLDDSFPVGIKTCHLQINPDQVVALFGQWGWAVCKRERIVSKPCVNGGHSMSALVVARFRNTAEVEEQGQRRMCLLKGKRLNVVVGDRVDYRELSAGQAVVEAIRERDTELTRINSAGKPEIVAANIDQIIVVVAPQPAADWFLVDRYLCAAELLAVTAAVALNKVELTEPADIQGLGTYGPIGYDTLTTSAKTGAGLDALHAQLAERRSVLVGAVWGWQILLVECPGTRCLGASRRAIT